MLSCFFFYSFTEFYILSRQVEVTGDEMMFMFSFCFYRSFFFCGSFGTTSCDVSGRARESGILMMMAMGILSNVVQFSYESFVLLLSYAHLYTLYAGEVL